MHGLSWGPVNVIHSKHTALVERESSRPALSELMTPSTPKQSHRYSRPWESHHTITEVSRKQTQGLNTSSLATGLQHETERATEALLYHLPIPPCVLSLQPLGCWIPYRHANPSPACGWPAGVGQTWARLPIRSATACLRRQAVHWLFPLSKHSLRTEGNSQVSVAFIHQANLDIYWRG